MTEDERLIEEGLADDAVTNVERRTEDEAIEDTLIEEIVLDGAMEDALTDDTVLELEGVALTAAGLDDTARLDEATSEDAMLEEAAGLDEAASEDATLEEAMEGEGDAEQIGPTSDKAICWLLPVPGTIFCAVFETAQSSPTLPGREAFSSPFQKRLIHPAATSQSAVHCPGPVAKKVYVGVSQAELQ